SSGAGRRRLSPAPATKRGSPPPRKASPESLVLHVDQLTRNVNEGHLKEIFGNFGEVVNVELAIDRSVNLPRGYGYVEYKTRADAEKALLFMDGAQIDGNVVRARFTLPQRQKVSSPTKNVPASQKKDALQKDDVDIEKDASQRQRDSSPCRKPLSPPRRRSPLAPRRGDSPRRRPDTPPRQRVDSPPRRRMDSPVGRRGSPPRRRPASPIRRRSPSPPPRRASPRRGRGSPVRRRSPIPVRRRSPPRRLRSPLRRSPIGRRRSRSPIRRHLRSRSRSISPHRGRLPPRRGRSSSSSASPSPRKGVRRISRSRSPR
ncbi:hypothetical protein MKX01_034732, partial [Papaver californicum]